jgi:hypothetical protein
MKEITVELEERRRKAAEASRRHAHALRGKCADLIRALPLERLAEHDLREIVAHAIRAGGDAAIALKALPNAGGDAVAEPRQPARPSRSVAKKQRRGRTATFPRQRDGPGDGSLERGRRQRRNKE